MGPAKGGYAAEPPQAAPGAPPPLSPGTRPQMLLLRVRPQTQALLSFPPRRPAPGRTGMAAALPHLDCSVTWVGDSHEGQGLTASLCVPVLREMGLWAEGGSVRLGLGEGEAEGCARRDRMGGGVGPFPLTPQPARLGHRALLGHSAVAGPAQSLTSPFLASWNVPFHR